MPNPALISVPRQTRLLMLLALLVPTAWADAITFGTIQLAPDNPSNGLLSFVVSNISGPGACDATFNSCSALTIDNGLLRVNYIESVLGAQVFTANLPNGFGPGATDPSTFVDFSVDATTWTLGLVTFSGTLSPGSIFLFGGASVNIPAAFSASLDGSTGTFALLATDSAPEPSSILLVGAGVAALALWRRNGR